MKSEECFECGEPATEDHHVIPQSLGGTKTVPLCGPCHDRVHDGGWKRRDSHSSLTREGLKRARERGVVLGSTKIEEAQAKSREVQTAKADAFATNIFQTISPLRDKGYTFLQIAEYLNTNGIATARGGDWHTSSVRNVCARANKLASLV